MRPNVLMFLLFFSSCALQAPGFGEPVSAGVSKARFEVRANGTDVVGVWVLYPVDQHGEPTAGPHPALVFVHGGAVPPERYFWQGEALAREGVVVAFPEHTLNLALTGIENGDAARLLLASPPRGSVLDGLVDPARVAVAGHSLGSVVAMKLLLQGGFAAGALEAGFQDPADQLAVSALERPTLFLAGRADCSAALDKVTSAWGAVPSPSALVVMEGVTHYQFTDSAQEDLDRGCTPSRPLEDAHRQISDALLAFLPGALAGQVNAAALHDVAGVEVQTR